MLEAMKPDSNRARAALWLALTAPATTVGSLAAYVFFPGATGQGIYMVARAWIALAPLVWTLWVARERIAWSPLRAEHRREAWLGAALLSVLVVVVVLGGYALVGERLLDPDALRRSVDSSGIGTPLRFAAAAIAISFLNSLLEEYFWRWFVYRRCETLVGARAAVPLAALLFTSHHVVTFCVLFGTSAGLAASAAVFVAGCAWSLCYLRWGSIWPGWWTHVVADLAGVAIGALVLFG